MLSNSDTNYNIFTRTIIYRALKRGTGNFVIFLSVLLFSVKVMLSQPRYIFKRTFIQRKKCFLFFFARKNFVLTLILQIFVASRRIFSIVCIFLDLARILYIN